MITRLSSSARIVALFAPIVAFAACGTDSPTSPGAHLAVGAWGGDKAQVSFDQTETHVTVNCSAGEFSGNISLDPNGRFTVDGTWNRSVGPILLNGDMPAQLSGQVIGNSLTFAIAVNDTIAKQITSVGPATVVFGKQPTTQVCPL
jgi:hypothetical protein